MIESDFIKHYIANASQIMWFLGAGTSRTAGMPTATDIIWDLKVNYYCREENQDIKTHDINNESVKRRIQLYMDSKGFPTLWSAEEYSHFFEITFGKDYKEQKKYLIEKLNNDKISLNIGHRALAALISMNKARILFTTNFDEVIEHAYAKVTEKVLSAYHLEGSYSTVDALNAERFPIYAKIHGDFKYDSVKNLADDLLTNDKEIQKCFLAASNRYGIVISGYSGRDNNVMSMLYEAIEQPNAFPSGIFWTVTSQKDISEIVREFIESAQKKGIKAEIVETGTFDSMLSKIWKQIPDRNSDIDKKVRSGIASEVNIAMPSVGTSFPVIRLNGLPIINVPEYCAVISTTSPLSNSEVKDLLRKNRANAVISKTDNLLGWGSNEELTKAIEKVNIISINQYKIDDPYIELSNSTLYRAFYERALVIALCNNKPLMMKNNNGFILAVDLLKSTDNLFTPLKAALVDRYNNPVMISGIVPRSQDVKWSEAVSVKLEIRNGKFWLILRPTIWIEPQAERQNHIEFIKKRTKSRYNKITDDILTAWIKILLGSNSKAETVEVSCYTDTDYPAVFKVNTRTAFSRK